MIPALAAALALTATSPAGEGVPAFTLAAAGGAGAQGEAILPVASVEARAWRRSLAMDLSLGLRPVGLERARLRERGGLGVGGWWTDRLAVGALLTLDLELPRDDLTWFAVGPSLRVEAAPIDALWLHAAGRAGWAFGSDRDRQRPGVDELEVRLEAAVLPWSPAAGVRHGPRVGAVLLDAAPARSWAVTAGWGVAARPSRAARRPG